MFKFSTPTTGASLRACWMCVWRCVLGACVRAAAAVVEVVAAPGREV